jgi:hypothetical protein
VTPKRGDDAAPPAVGVEYRVVLDDKDAVKGWEDLKSQEPGNTRWAYEQMRDNPGCRTTPPNGRHTRLKRDLATGYHGNRELPLWQIEVTGAARIWYLVDDEKKTCWIKHAGRAHPRQTE